MRYLYYIQSAHEKRFQISSKGPTECTATIDFVDSEKAKEFMHFLSKDGKCTDETCESCGKKKSGIQWRLSSIAKKQPLPGKGFTYLHIRVNTKQGHITGFKTVPTKQTTDFYQQVAGIMYNEIVEKYS